MSSSPADKAVASKRQKNGEARQKQILSGSTTRRVRGEADLQAYIASQAEIRAALEAVKSGKKRKNK